MSDLIQQILEELPNRGGRSSLDPFRELILEMRRRGYSYRETARLLAERCDMKISHAAIHNFVRLQSRLPAGESSSDRPQSVVTKAERGSSGNARDQRDVRARIAALKGRVAPSESTEEAGYRFDPDQPLMLDHEQS
jgi:hypothetical protein